jgi:hypothetical protein
VSIERKAVAWKAATDLQIPGWARQNTALLAATAINLNGATQRRNAANLLLNGLAQTGLQIDITDTTVRTVSSVMASGTGITAGTGDLGAGSGSEVDGQSERSGDSHRHPDSVPNYGDTATFTGAPAPMMAVITFTAFSSCSLRSRQSVGSNEGLCSWLIAMAGFG